MIERIMQIMELEGIKPGEFAEQIGINRSAISHILNGRNKPSLDVVNRILSRYDYINTDWLLFGKGDLRKKNIAETHQAAAQPAVFSGQQPSLFDEAPKQNPKPEFREENQPKTMPNIPQNIEHEQKDVIIPTTKKITKLVIFYSDNTFDTFAPDNGIF